MSFKTHEDTDKPLIHIEATSSSDGANSTISSLTKGAPHQADAASTLMSSTSESSLSLKRALSQRRMSSSERSNSDSCDLRFSKRGSELSEEGQALKPATFWESQRKSQAFPVSQLRFKSVGLVGRHDEKRILEACLERVTATRDDHNKDTTLVADESRRSSSRELVLIRGDAGTGKTALSQCLTKSVRRAGGLYVKGKFDLYLRDEPYAGIAGACQEMCGTILLIRENKAFEKIRNELRDTLGSENLCLLINIIPELSEIVGDESIMDDVMTKQSGEETRARFNYAFRMLLRVVASNFGALVILLDDIQWSDAATLDLVHVLIADRDNPNLMVIGVYRSSEVDEDHTVSRLVREMKDMEEQEGFNLSEIEIGNLDASQVNEIIMRLLSIDEPEKTRGLAEVCYKRSYGNVFSLLVFLEMLQAEKLLHYSLGSFQWNWDEQKILSETSATANVVDLMKQKIEKLPTSIGQRLSIAACLGFSFEPAILNTVWDAFSRQKGIIEEQYFSEEGEQDVDITWIGLVEKEGFLEMEPDGTAYRWVHDNVQEAAISLVTLDELPGLKARVGKILVKELDEKDLEPYVFTVVNLLHEGVIPEDESEQIQLAELCLQASKKAGDLSAFESAAKYAEIGVNSLPTSSWSNHYDLTVDLYSTAAEAACCLGNTEQLEKYYNEVLEQKDRPVFDKLRVYHAMISYLGGALGRPSDAIELIVEILVQFGIKFPKRKASRLLSTISGMLKAKRRMSSIQLEDIAKMPTMDDRDHLEMMRLLDQLFITAYLAESDLLPLSIFASTQLMMENGLSEYSAPAFAGLALLLGAALGDVALASKIGNFALLAMTNIECKNMDSRAVLYVNAFVFCWTEPITNMTSKLLKAYETGLSVGDNENACWCIAQYIVICFQSGKPLGKVEADCEIYVKQMIEFKRETCHADICIYIETIQNLMGSSEGDPTVMKSEQRFLAHSDHTVLGVFYSCQGLLFLYFGEYEKGAKLAIERGDAYSKGVPGHVWIMMETFVRGMSLYAMARKTRKRVYKKHAKRVHKTIKSWLKNGNPNIKHYHLLFNAESAALKGKLDAAEGWYQSAIVSATRRGHTHESAFASERYGEFLLNERNDPEEARHKIDDAIRRYGEWGAAKKVHVLREKHQNLWRRPSEVVFQVE